MSDVLLVATRKRLGYRPHGPQERNFSHWPTPLEETEVGPAFDWTPVITTLLLGARDMHSPLSLLRGREDDVIRDICSYLVYKYKEGAVVITPPAYSVARVPAMLAFHGDEEDSDEVDEEVEVVFREGYDDCPALNALIPEQYQVEPISRYKKDRPQIAFSPCRAVEFPEPKGINVNMMPFVFDDRESLPRELRPYYDKIISKCPVAEEEDGDVMYLTVQEGFVEADVTQRRPGLHVEAPSASVAHYQSGQFVAGLEHRWGWGHAYSADERTGGLYLASNISDTTAVWDALVDSKLGAVNTHGDIEHLRPYIGKGKKLPADLLVWLTDHTPHEALPQKEDGYRQFFRLVTGDISVWFAAQSTPNPKVPVPSHVKVIGESKFQTPSKGATRIYTVEDFGDDVVPTDKQLAYEAEKKRMQIHPINLFREADEYKGKYSKYDSAGIPTHWEDGTELSKKGKKKLANIMRKHTKAVAQWQKRQN